MTRFSFVGCSFNSDYQMVLDAQVVVTVRPVANAAAAGQRELLYPPRHQITLPLNNLNFIFHDEIQTSFNQTTKLTSDKYVIPCDAVFWSGLIVVFLSRAYFLDWDGLGFLDAVEQNFNPDRLDIERRTALGK